nr:DUF3126 family protein [Ancylobacter gelatini]
MRPGKTAAVHTSTAGARTVEKKDNERVQTYLRRLFGNANIRVVARPKKKDSAEVYIGDEFIGVMFEDKEDGDLSYNFQMAILGDDLED